MVGAQEQLLAAAERSSLRAESNRLLGVEIENRCCHLGSHVLVGGEAVHVDVNVENAKVEQETWVERFHF